MKAIARRLLAAILFAVMTISAAMAQNTVVISNMFVAPQFVATDGSGNLFVVDYTGTMGAFLFEVPLVAGSYATTPIPLATGKLPYANGEGIAVDKSGNLYVGFNGATGGVIEVMAPAYTTVNTLYSASGVQPLGLSIDPAGDVFYVDHGIGAVVKLPAGTPSNRQVLFPLPDGGQSGGLAIDSKHNLFVGQLAYGPLSSSGDYVQELLASNGYSSGPKLGAGALHYGALAIDANDDFYAVDSIDNTVTKLAAPGYDSPTIVDAEAGQALNTIAVDHWGDLFITNGGAAPALLELPLLPSVTSVSPDNGSAAGGGAPVVINGENLTGATAVYFGSTPAANVIAVNSRQVSAVAPPHGGGTIDVTVVTPIGTTAVVTGDQYTYAAAPAVQLVTPSGGSTAGGASVTIAGAGFTGAMAVEFGAVAATSFSVDSDLQITAVAPAQAAGTVDVTVVTPNGTSPIFHSLLNNGDQFTYSAPPTASEIAPAGGSAGSLVAIIGTGFVSAPGITQVLFGTTSATDFTVDSATHISATVPPGSGTVAVTVTTPAGTTAVSAAMQYTYETQPVVTALGTASGPATGGTSVVIIGSGFTGVTDVLFGDTAAAGFTVNGDTQITARAPAGSGTVDVTVANAVGTSTASAADRFTYIARPVVSALTPSHGPLAGGTSVVITGTGLSGASSVSFGAVAATSFRVDSATQITAVSPAGSAGAVDVTVTTPGRTSAAGAADRFTFIGETTVTVTSSANPSSFGQAVTFTASVASMSGVPSGTVTFKDGAAMLFTGTLANGMSSYTTDTLAPGSHVVTATYGGDGNLAGSTGGLTQQVAGATATSGQAYRYQTTLGVPGVAQPDGSHFSAPVIGAVDSVNGHLLIADTGNHRIQILDTSTLAVIATLGTAGVPGNDNAHLDAPAGVGFDAGSNRIFVADSGNERVQLFDARSFAYLTTLDTSSFSAPGGVQGSATGRLLVADTGNQRVQIFDGATLAPVATLGSTGAAGSDDAHFNAPMDAVLNPAANEILVADSGNARVQRFDATTLAYRGTIGGADLNIASNAYLGRPVAVTFDPLSNLVLVADDGADQRVQAFDALSYGYVLTLGTTGSAGAGNGQFAGPAGAAVDAAHARMFVGDRQNDRVQVFSIAPPTLFASVLPGSRSVQLGHPATLFASLVNADTTGLQGCQAALPVTAPAGLTLSYQATDPATNGLIGTPDTPVAISGENAAQSFLLTFQSTEPLTASDMAVDFDCLGIGPAAVTSGVDTVDLTISGTPTADIVALAATPTGNGVAAIPAGGTAAFAVASANVGATAQIIVSVDTGAAQLPMTETLCQSNPATGACLARPSSTVTLRDAAGAVPTFSVFLHATGPIPFAPAQSRVFVRFKDSAGGLHGSTSVAVETD